MSNGERIRMTNGCLIVVAAEYGTKRGLGVLGDSIRMCMWSSSIKSCQTLLLLQYM